MICRVVPDDHTVAPGTRSKSSSVLDSSNCRIPIKCQACWRLSTSRTLFSTWESQARFGCRCAHLYGRFDVLSWSRRQEWRLRRASGRERARLSHLCTSVSLEAKTTWAVGSRRRRSQSDCHRSSLLSSHGVLPKYCTVRRTNRPRAVSL